MNINDFNELTNFIHEEYLKMQESFGISLTSKSLIRYTERTLKRYIKLYDKPLYRKCKRDIVLQEAIETMPHGWFWRVFHSKLNAQIKMLEKTETEPNSPKNEPETKPIQTSLVPTVIKSVSVPVINDY